MSYMRHPAYVYDNGIAINIYYENGHVALPYETVEELAVMIHAKLGARDGVAAAEERAIAKHAGEFGCDALCAKHGLPTTIELVQQALRHPEAGSPP